MTQPTDTIAQSAAERGIRLQQSGSGQPILLLHGGGGPATLRPFAQRLAADFTVLLPTHPGFDDTPRPREIGDVRALAALYAGLITAAGLNNVIVAGFSLGGWLAAELVASYPEQIAGLMLVDAVGLAVPGEPVLNANALPPGAIADYSYYQPDLFRIDVAGMPAAARAAMQANFATLAVYAQAHYMQDPSLEERLAAIAVPTLVLWGDSDRVVHPAYGRAYARAITGAQFEVLEQCGHLPQLEQPALLQAALDRFAAALPRAASLK